MTFTLQEQRALLPGFNDAQLHEFFAAAPRPVPAAPSRASRPAAAGPSAAAAAAFAADVARRTVELDAVAAQLAARGIDTALARPHLSAIEGWSRHFTEARARADAAMPGQHVAGDSWDNAFANARARRAT
jgi:hypothetical protein